MMGLKKDSMIKKKGKYNKYVQCYIKHRLRITYFGFKLALTPKDLTCFKLCSPTSSRQNPSRRVSLYYPGRSAQWLRTDRLSAVMGAFRHSFVLILQDQFWNAAPGGVPNPILFICTWRVTHAHAHAISTHCCAQYAEQLRHTHYR